VTRGASLFDGVLTIMPGYLIVEAHRRSPHQSYDPLMQPPDRIVHTATEVLARRYRFASV
jgi:hypothetical protein